MKVSNDIAGTLEIIHKGISKESCSSGYFPLHLFTNENIRGIMNNINLDNKKVLLPCASGDQIFNFLMFDNVDITAFDINILTYYYFELKRIAILILNKEEFMDFFYPSKIDFKNKFLNYEVYEKIKCYLPLEVKVYWDSIFACCSSKKIKKSEIFKSVYYNRNIIKCINPYLINNNYSLLRKKLKDFNLKFINCDFRDLDIYLNSLYDFIYLSNIPSASIVHDNNQIKTLKITLDKLNFYLKRDGCISVNYFYNYMADEYVNDPEELYNLKRRKEEFNTEYDKLVIFPNPYGQYNRKYDEPRDRDALILRRKI